MRRSARPASGASAVAGDLSDPATPGRLVAEVVAAFGGLDILVNNAGTIRRAPAEETSDEDWDYVLDVNLGSVFRLCREAGRGMLAAGHGKIINIASLLSFQGGIRVPAYAAAKSGVAAITKALANEWAGRGVNVNAIAPGYMRTDNTAALRADPERSRQILERIPAGALGRARGSRRHRRLPRLPRLRLRARPRPRRRRRLDGPLMTAGGDRDAATPGDVSVVGSASACSRSASRAALPGATATAAPPTPAQPFAVRLADSVLSRWPTAAAISDKGFEYTTGIVLYGIAEVYRHTRDPRYLDYIRAWVDRFAARGRQRRSRRRRGRAQPGPDPAGEPGALPVRGDGRREVREGRALASRSRFDTFPRNSAGGFWHKQKYPDEMWLDGIYMAEPFLVRYGRMFAEPGFCFDTAVAQTLLVGERTRAGGGLFRHAWDADRNAAWADPATGVSPEVWGRAMGWYVMALVDILAELPEEHPGYARLRDLLREAAGGIAAPRTRRPASGTRSWTRAIGPRTGSRPPRARCSSTRCKRGADDGLLGPAEAEVARRGWSGLAEPDLPRMPRGGPSSRAPWRGRASRRTWRATSTGRRLSNSPHGLCGMLLAASAMEWPRARPVAAAEGPAAPEPPRAFPGAEGFGAFAVGGAAATSTTSRTCPTRDRGACATASQTARGPRTIVFDLSGTIFLRSELKIDKPFLTLAGQTAPGDGVTVAGFTTSISGTHDVIVRYLRFRAGDINCPSFQGDALNVFESRDVIIDHVSASWSIDETLSVTHSDRVTVQWSIIAESLNAACHAKGRHGYGSLLR